MDTPSPSLFTREEWQ